MRCSAHLTKTSALRMSRRHPAADSLRPGRTARTATGGVASWAAVAKIAPAAPVSRKTGKGRGQRYRLSFVRPAAGYRSQLRAVM
jgi:hypothetical protein